MSETPKVSVVITAYNAARWIEETLDSVLAQTYRDYEVVVVDDGSTDDTQAIVARYAPPVRYIHQENRGQPAARNVGIRSARGTYVAFVDADDLWLPQKLARQMSLFESTPNLGLVYSDAYVFDSDSGITQRRVNSVGRLPENDIFLPLLMGNFIPSPTPIVRRDALESAGYFDESPDVHMGGGEDWDMWLRIAAHQSAGAISEPLARYRVHPSSMLQSMDIDAALRGRLGVLEKAFRSRPEIPDDVRARAIATQYVTAGRWKLGRGSRRAARQLFAKAIRTSPTTSGGWAFYAVSIVPVAARKTLGKARSWWWRRGLPGG